MSSRLAKQFILALCLVGSAAVLSGCYVAPYPGPYYHPRPYYPYYYR